MDLVTVKLILVLSKRWNVPARHGDIPNAYVKAEKEEHLDIFMKVPKGMQIIKEELQGFGMESPGEVALLLKKSLYRLKQAGRLWSKLLHSKLTENGYKQCTTDICLYYKHQGQEWTIVGVYVDDLLVTGTKQCAVDEFFAGMETLSIKDLGVVQKFLGLRISLDDTQGYILDQEVMIDVLLRDFKLESANGVRTPIRDECNDDNKDDVDCLPARGASSEPSLSAFRSLVGSLLWIARCTRPDICFAVHKATRQTHKPTTKDWKIAKRIARYLKATKNLRLHLNGNGPTQQNVKIECWSDADFAADKADRRELLGVRELLLELKLQVCMPMPMWMDNQAAIKQLEAEKSTTSAKHVDIRFKFICHYAREGIVVPKYVKTESMMADVLTKSLPAPRMEELRKMFNLRTIQAEVEEEC
uniref:Reverse transcriptase Ty1/copia-type domain-containing protein n=1 Tax=Peronospora matthiolae TaxID=2874970 RepID=A0AAV1T6R3_9STRA